MVGGQIARRQHQHTRRKPKQFSVGGDEAGMFEREENPPRGGARQAGGLGKIAQRHRLLAAAEHLQHA